MSLHHRRAIQTGSRFKTVKNLLTLAFHSLQHRKLTAVLCTASIALSVLLFSAVGLISKSARAGFEGAISGVDLIAGARGGAINLLLYTVYHAGSPTANVSMDVVEQYKNHRAVKAVIPVSLGDSHRGFRVVGTDDSYFDRFRFGDKKSLQLKRGNRWDSLFDTVIGSEVARQLEYETGRKIILTHGISKHQGIMDHDTLPFEVTGILEPTGTPIDRAIFVKLEALEAIHYDWKSGAPPVPGQETSRDEILQVYDNGGLKPEAVTAFYIITKNRVLSLALQREINTHSPEALSAILPGITMQELWRILGYATESLRLMSVFIIVVGLLGILIALYLTAEQRRHEFAVLRSLGMSPRSILTLVLLDSGILALSGSLLGQLTAFLLFLIARPLVTELTGFFLVLPGPDLISILTIPLVTVIAGLLSLAPALRSMRRALADGLAP